MKKIYLLFLATFLISPVLAGVSNTVSDFDTAVINNGKKLTVLSCIHGKFYHSEGGNQSGEFDIFAAVCRGEKSNAHPTMTKAEWAIFQENYSNDQKSVRKLLKGEKCSFSEKGWSCLKWRKLNKAKINNNENTQRFDDDAYEWAKFKK